MKSDGSGRIALLDNDAILASDSLVRCTDERIEVPAGENLRGRVINSFGEPLDDEPAVPFPSKQWRAHIPSWKAPSVMARRPSTEYFPSGLKVIDAFFPIGFGSVTAIKGQRGVGKSHVALDVYITQHRANLKQLEASKHVHCIYVVIGRSERALASILKTLKGTGAMASTTVVAATDTATPASRYLAPFTGLAIADARRRHGGRALIVYDDLCAHHSAARSLGFDHDVASEYASILAQSGALDDEHGGGSVTSFPLVSVQPGQDREHSENEKLVEQITSLCDDVIPLSGTGVSHLNAVPVAFAALNRRTPQPCQPPTLRLYMQRLRSLLLDLKQRISDVNKAMQFGIEPEAELDDLLELHAKLVLLLAPSSDAIEAAGDSETHDMDFMAPVLAKVGQTDPERGDAEVAGPTTLTSINPEALLRQRKEHRRKQAARRMAGLSANADVTALKHATLNKRASTGQLIATLFAVTHGYLTHVPLPRVLLYESWLWGALATLPAPPEGQKLWQQATRGTTDAAGKRPPASLLEVLPLLDPPPVATEVVAETLSADASGGRGKKDMPKRRRVGARSEVWAAVDAAVLTVTEQFVAEFASKQAKEDEAAAAAVAAGQ